MFEFVCSSVLVNNIMILIFATILTFFIWTASCLTAEAHCIFITRITRLNFPTATAKVNNTVQWNIEAQMAAQMAASPAT